jgi:hypothetical protein
VAEVDGWGVFDGLVVGVGVEIWVGVDEEGCGVDGAGVEGGAGVGVGRGGGVPVGVPTAINCAG